MDAGNKSRHDIQLKGHFSVYGTLAGEEALFRALLAERDLQHARAGFWVAVYAEIRGERMDGVN